MMIIDDPGGLGFRIERIWAFITIHDDGDEGVTSFRLPDGTLMPMIAADEARLHQLRPIAERLSRSGKPIVLVRFDQRVEIERFE
jgi:hypothetical protein